MKHRQCLRSWERHSPHQSDWCPEVLPSHDTDTAHMGSMNRSPPAFILLVIIKHPHSMVSTMCGSPCKGQPWLGWREGTQTGPLWRLACPACSPSDRLQPPHSIAHFKRSKGKATKPVNLRRMARWGPTDALGRPDKSAETPIHGNMYKTYKTHNKYEQYIKRTINNEYIHLQLRWSKVILLGTVTRWHGDSPNLRADDKSHDFPS